MTGLSLKLMGKGHPLSSHKTTSSGDVSELYFIFFIFIYLNLFNSVFSKALSISNFSMKKFGISRAIKELQPEKIFKTLVTLVISQLDKSSDTRF